MESGGGVKQCMLLFLILLLISFPLVTAYEEDIVQPNIFQQVISFFRNLFHSTGVATAWGQANDCSVYPDKEKMLRAGDRVDCSDYCSYDKCAIDIWYDRVQYFGTTPNHPDWGRLTWYKEIAGEGVYFSAPSTHQYWWIEVYCCPESVPDISEHDTKVYVCEDGDWDYKSRYEYDEYCRWDTSGTNKCWCSDDDDNFYVDETDGVHCRGSARDSWCSPPESVFECQSNSDCPSSHVCVFDPDWAGGGSHCELREGECIENSDCPSGYYCANWVCKEIDPWTGEGVDMCDTDADCPSGQYCDYFEDYLYKTCLDDDTDEPVVDDDDEACGCWVTLPTLLGGGCLVPDLFCVVGNWFQTFPYWVWIIVGLIVGALILKFFGVF